MLLLSADNKQHIRAVILLALLIIVANAPLLAGRYYSVGDTRDVYIPIESFFRSEMLQGRLPAWHPDIAWGYPVIASAQIGFFYPPLLIARLLPLSVYFPLVYLAHLFALGAGTYFLAKTVGRTDKAAFLAGLLIALGGFTTLHTTHLNIILTLAWFPWQLLAAANIAKRSIPTAPGIAALALSIGAPFLAGQIQMPILTAAITLIWLFYLRRLHSRWDSRFIQKTAVAVLLAALISAAQLVPTFELAANSSRSTSGEFDLQRANQHSYPLYHLPTLLFPRFYGNDDTYWGKRLQIEYGFYLGTIPLLLAALSISRPARMSAKIRRLSPPANRLSSDVGILRFFKWLLIITFLLALGGLSPFRLIGVEPSLWYFSAPARWLFFASFSVAMLAAASYDARADTKRLARSLTIVALALTIVLLAANTVFHLSSADSLSHLLPAESAAKHQAKISSLLNSARQSSLSLASPYTYLPLAAIFLTVLSPASRRRSIILAVTAAELVILFWGTTPTLPWSQTQAEPVTVQQLPDSVRSKQARILTFNEGGDTGAYFTNPESRADAAVREQQRHLLVPLIHAQHNVAGVAWPASLDLQSQAPVLERLKSGGSSNFDLTTASQFNIGAALSLQNDQPAILEISPQPRAALLDSDSKISQPLSYHTDNPQQLTFDLTTGTAGDLIVRDTVYPGWRAYIDESNVPIETAQEIFRSIEVPPGTHRITMKYVPTAIYFGLSLTIPTLAICLVLVLQRFLQRRAGRPFWATLAPGAELRNVENSQVKQVGQKASARSTTTALL